MAKSDCLALSFGERTVKKRPFQAGVMGDSLGTTLTEEGSHLAKVLLPWTFPELLL